MDRAVGPSWCSRIVTQRPSGALEHFDVLGYLLVATTVISLSMMYFISRRIDGLAAVPAH
jgi:hypothetical protein